MSAKNVVVVDDEVEITNSLKEFLCEKGFQVHTFTAADQAYDYFKENHADLILSDIKMPGKSGIDLFKQYFETKTVQPKVPFVLMTGYTDLIGAENAYSMGVSELIAKPFDLDSLNLVLNYLLNLEGAVGSSQEKYFPVRIDEFIDSRSNEFDIYLKVVDKYVLVTRSGQEFSEQRIKNFSKKGATHIYLKPDNFAKYTDLQFAVSSSLTKRPMDIARKTKVLNHLISSVSQTFMNGQINKEFLNKSLLAFESYADVALRNTQLTLILNQMLLASPKIVEKSSLRAVLSSMVTGTWKWKSSKIQSRIILSALMCDVGLKNHPELLNKKNYEFTATEQNIYEQHPMESYKILTQIPDMPEEIALVTLQHHENSAGLGFPQKLTRSKLHSYSVIIHCVNEFIETLFNQSDPNQTEKALNHLLSAQGNMLNQQVIKTLYMIFQLKIPKSLENLLLPDQTSRLN